MLTIETIALLAGITPADLSDVPDPRGRLDHLASKILENGARGLGPDLQATFLAARPLIDGALVKYLGHVRIPESAMKATGEAVTSIQALRERKSA